MWLARHMWREHRHSMVVTLLFIGYQGGWSMANVQLIQMIFAQAVAGTTNLTLLAVGGRCVAGQVKTLLVFKEPCEAPIETPVELLGPV